MSLINWYPGHIAKAQRVLQEQLKLIDFVLELVDARLPEGGRFDVTNQLLQGKPRVLVFTKSDLAMPDRTQAWMQHYRNQGLPVIALNAQTGQGLPGLHKALALEGEKIRQKMVARGRLPRASRVMVVGMPNVGKSSLINKLAKRKAAQVGNKPGVTKSVNWIRLGKDLELMDTPGIIPPKLEDQELALKLALVGSVSTEAYDPILVAPEALRLLAKYSPEALTQFKEPNLEGIARQRGFVRPGGEPDLERTSRELMHDLRTGALGAVSLDFAPKLKAALEAQAAEAAAEEAEPQLLEMPDGGMD